MRRPLAALLLLAVAAVPLQADFSDIARAIDSQRGVQKVWLPFMGLARMMVRTVEPEGVHDFQIAIFEGGDRMDVAQLNGLMQRSAGPGFVPLVRSWSRKSGEFAFIYVRPEKGSQKMELIVLGHDDEETALIRVVVDAEVLARSLSEPGSVVHIAGK